MLADFQKQEKLLKQNNLKTPKSILARSVTEVEVAVKKVKTPCVLKIYSLKHLHRTEVGGVATGIDSINSAKEQFRRMIKIPQVEGVIVQEQVKGFEFVIGVKTDPVFGQVVMLGTGGTMIEVFDDVSFRLVPVTKKDAKEMLEEIKGKILLSGFRGAEKIPETHLTDAVLSVSQMAHENNVKEADFNPVIVNSKGAFFCDVKIIL